MKSTSTQYHDKERSKELVEKELSYHENYFSIIPGMDNPGTIAIENSSDLTEKHFQEKYVDNGIPCLVKGAVKDWPAMKRFRDKDYWLSNFENKKVIAHAHRNYHNYSMGRMMLHDAIERLFKEKDFIFSIPGLAIWDKNKLQELEKDLGKFPFLPSPPKPRSFPEWRFFIYKRAGTAWHCHFVDESLMCQMKGAKRVGLLSPKMPGAEYVSDFLRHEMYLKDEKLDESLNLEPLVIDVEEGDALYLPPYWYHSVIPKDGDVGFTSTFCWRSPAHMLGDLSDYFVRYAYDYQMWPFNSKTLLMPFAACYAAIKFFFRKLKLKKQ